MLLELLGVLLANQGLEIRRLKGQMETPLEIRCKSSGKVKRITPFEWLNENGGAAISDQVRDTLRSFMVLMDFYHTAYERAPLYNLSHISFVLTIERLFQERVKLGFFPGVISNTIHKFALNDASFSSETPGRRSWRQEVAKMVNRKL